jgi:calcineurin-like phosphoesterase family protein
MWRMFPEFGLLLTHVPVHSSSLHKTGRKGQPDFTLQNIHGHIHNRESPSGPYVNVSVEAIGYIPVNIETLRIKK